MERASSVASGAALRRTYSGRAPRGCSGRGGPGWVRRRRSRAARRHRPGSPSSSNSDPARVRPQRHAQLLLDARNGRSRSPAIPRAASSALRSGRGAGCCVEPLPIALVVAVRPDERDERGVGARPADQRLRRPIRRFDEPELPLQAGERQHAVLFRTRRRTPRPARPSIWCPP